MLCNNNVEGCMNHADGGCIGGFGCIINLIVILVIMQFLTSIFGGNSVGGACC